MFSVIGTGLFGGLGALATSYGAFTALRFLASVCQYGLFGVAFVWCKESIDIHLLLRHRVSLTMIKNYIYSRHRLLNVSLKVFISVGYVHLLLRKPEKR